MPRETVRPRDRRKGPGLTVRWGLRFATVAVVLAIVTSSDPGRLLLSLNHSVMPEQGRWMSFLPWRPPAKQSNRGDLLADRPQYAFLVPATHDGGVFASDSGSAPSRLAPNLGATRVVSLYEKTPPRVLVSAARPGVAAGGPIGPPQRSVLAPSAGQGGIPVGTRLYSGEGAGPGWCIANGGYPSGASYDGVYACGPSLSPSEAFDTEGFQCVELSTRFLWIVYGKVVRNVDSGSDFVWLANQQLHIPVGLPGPGSAPAPGDIISLAGPIADPDGHTAVVTAVNINSHGNGAIQIMEENGSYTGWDAIDVHDWVEAYGDPRFSGGYYYYTQVSWLELNRRSTRIRSSLSVAPSVAPPPEIWAHGYSLRDLGPETTEATAVTDANQVAGIVNNPIDQNVSSSAMVFSGGRVHPLSQLPGLNYSTVGTAIDDRGRVAAWSVTSDGTVLPYVVRLGRRPRWRQLHSSTGRVVQGQALGIDATGRVSGWVFEPDGMSSLGAIWTPTGQTYRTRLLRPSAGYADPIAVATDTYGDAVGSEMRAMHRTAAVLWTADGTPHRLPSLYGNPELDLARAVTERWDGAGRVLTIVGSVGTWTGTTTAAVWEVQVHGSRVNVARPRLLGMPRGYQSSLATSVNQKGWILGSAAMARGSPSAFLWRENGRQGIWVDQLIGPRRNWRILQGEEINQNNDIAAIGCRVGFGDEARPHAILLQPQPRWFGPPGR